MKKSELTRAKLITAVSNLLKKGQKISVASISKEAKTAYGTFYRYFNNLDEIHAATMIQIVVDVAEKLEQQLKKEKSNLFKVYYAWYVAIDLFKGDYMANWLIDNPSSINDAWVLTQPMTSQWLQNAIADKEEPELTADNLRHFKMAQTYIFWTYQNALRELLKGRKSIHVYTDLMNSVNLMNLPSKTNKKYLKKLLTIFLKQYIPVKKDLKKFTRYGLLIFAILVSFLPIFNPLQIFSNLQNYSFDTLQRLLPREIYVEDPVVIIDIDDRSLAEIGQWPWPRNQLAKLTDQAYAAAALGFDIVFAESDRTNPQNFISSYPLNEALKKELSKLPSNDELFAQAILNHGTVVLGQALNNKNNTKPYKAKYGLVTQGDDPKQFIRNYLGAQNNIKLLDDSATGVGSMSIGNNDAIVRQLPTFERIDDQLVPSLALEMARVAVGSSTFQIKSSNASSEEAYGAKTGINNIKLGPLTIPTTPEGNAWVYFAPTKNIPTVSAGDVISGAIPTEFFEGKVALVGTSAAGLLDLRSTPTEKNIPGVTIIAQFIQQIFANEFLQRPDWLFGAEFLAGLILAILITLSIQALGPIGGLSVLIAGSGGIIGTSYYFFKSKLFLVDPISPLIISLSVYVAVTFFNFLFTELERSRVRGAFAQYLSPEMVNRLAESSESLVLGGERKEMTFLFSDIRGFTKISEQYKDDPEALTQLINQLLTVLSNSILEHGGTIDKYMGDCIMAFWNAPTDQADHRQLAIKAAHSMNEALDAFNAQTEGNLDFKLEIGIGINSGNCIVGNMGSDKRFDYTVLGDAVNLASRLESQSSNYGLHMIVGENTHMDDSEFTIIEIDKIAVKGKSSAETIYTCFKPEMKFTEEFLKKHEAFLVEYRSQNWDGANLLIDELIPSSNELELYYKHMRARIEEYIASPPASDWEGVYVAKNK